MKMGAVKKQNSCFMDEKAKSSFLTAKAVGESKEKASRGRSAGLNGKERRGGSEQGLREPGG